MAFNVAHFLAQQAVTQPTAAAVRAPLNHDSDGAIRYTERSFAKLESEASATGHYFFTKGIRRGSRVLLMVRPGLDLIRIVFALFKMGAVPIVIDPGMGLKSFLVVSSSKPRHLSALCHHLECLFIPPSFRGWTLRSRRAWLEKQIGGFKGHGLSRWLILRKMNWRQFYLPQARLVCQRRAYEHGMFRTREAIRRIWNRAGRGGSADVTSICTF